MAGRTTFTNTFRSSRLDNLEKTNMSDTEENENEASKPGETSDVVSFAVSSQLTGTRKFSSKTKGQISAFPIIVDFRRLIQLTNKASNAASIIPGVTNQDLLHAVVGLYDVTLSDMTTDVLYSTVCDKWAKTILFIQDLKETVSYLEERRKGKHKEVDAVDEKDDKKSEGKDRTVSDVDDVFEPEDSADSVFKTVFSDTESEEEDDDSDDEDFSKGIHTFIEASSIRRKLRDESSSIEASHVGIENRLVGCLTFEKKYVKHKEKVVHLTLLAVRRRYRGYGLGKYLMKQVLDPSVAGPYDAVVVHADTRAMDFFNRCGFTDDVVLNSRWSELAEQFTNCTLMSFLPGFSDPVLLENVKPNSSLVELEKEMKEWKTKSLEAHQAQVTCYFRLKTEILQLQKLTDSQSSVINDLALKNKQLMQDQREKVGYLESCVTSGGKSLSHTHLLEDNLDTTEVMKDLENRVEMLDMMMRYKQGYAPLVDREQSEEQAFVRSEEEPYDHTLDAAMFYQITEDFKHALKKDPSLSQINEVTMITKACLSRKAETDFWLCLAALNDPCKTEELYFCVSGETTDRLQTILKDGFSQQDFCLGAFGKCLTFTRHPSRTTNFSKSSQLLLAEVAVGKMESSVIPDRTSPTAGYDSVQVFGNAEDKLSEEILIYNPCQARPICLISYNPVNKEH